jgi:hypothetical protein
MADEVMNTEQQNTSAEQETQPEVNEETAVTEPQVQANGESETTTTNSAEAPSAADNATDESTVEGEEGPFLTIRYNKEDIPLSQEEAINWAQKGMHYFNKLDYVAAQSDCSVGELLDSIIKKMDDAKLAELQEQFGDDTETINDMMRIYHDKQKEKYEKVISERKLAEEQEAKSKVEKIGEEFIELQKEFPELTAVKDLPKSVLKDAETMSLEHAYLRYLIKNQKTITAAKEKEKEAATASTGSLQTATEDVDTSVSDFARGVWGG